MNIYIHFLVIRTVLLAVSLLILLVLKIRKIKFSRFWLPSLILLWLLFPNVIMFKDGGTKIYCSPVYQIISWNQMDSMDDYGNIIPGRKDTQVFLFPDNFTDHMN